ncbi:MAG: phospho-sugar mutase [Bacteroidales bacterium]|nr:phospho-sugar mutase [Bacteroidales bacterium]
MENQNVLNEVRNRAEEWLNSPIDDASKNAIREMLNSNETELIESFYRNLEFGTGGLRGIMGVGTNRMNIYTVGMATQGLCNYLLEQFSHRKEISVAVAHDCRNNSPLFAEITAQICVANGIKAYLFDGLRPTPELSFAIRQLGCQSGVVVTASHNPKEYNGYKVYWEDGGQIINPHDVNIIREVQNIKSIGDVKFDGDREKIITLGEEMDALYIDEVVKQSINPEVIAAHPDIKIVYTPIHGTGVKMVPRALKKMGFTNIYNVPEQDVVDGNFPTVVSPNPEESAALDMALKKADEVGADLVMASDPDADRVGIAIRDNSGKLILVNGHQTASLLSYYLLSQWSERGKLTGKEYIVKTIVTTELIADMANHYKVSYWDVLTGFKFIADIIRKNEDTMTFIGGGEESYGFMIGDFVRDKDAIASCSMLAEIAAWARSRGKSMYDILIEMYLKFSLYQESLINVVRKGKSGAEEIQQMMAGFRKNPPDKLIGSRVVTIRDYLEQESTDSLTGAKTPLDLPKSNVLQFLLEDGSKISVRPSGTEPKIKFYFSVFDRLEKREDYKMVKGRLEEKILNIKRELKLI